MFSSCRVQSCTHRESQLVLLTMAHKKWLLGRPARQSLQDSPRFPLVIGASYLREVTTVDTFITEVSFSNCAIRRNLGSVRQMGDWCEGKLINSWELNEFISQLVFYLIQECKGWSPWADRNHLSRNSESPRCHRSVCRSHYLEFGLECNLLWARLDDLCPSIRKIIKSGCIWVFLEMGGEVITQERNQGTSFRGNILPLTFKWITDVFCHINYILFLLSRETLIDFPA